MPKIGEIPLTSVDEFDFRLLIKALGKGEKGSRSLTFAEASLLIQGFAKGKVSRPQMAAAMMLMRVRGETINEVAGVVAGLRQICHRAWSELVVDIDWPVYAGKREQLPWLLLVAKLLANKGIKVMLHGDSQALPHRRHVESCIQALGIKACVTAVQAKAALAADNIVYVGAGNFTAVLDECRLLHQELGLRSIIQTASRCMNPANAPISLRSYFHPGLDDLHQQVCQILIAEHEYTNGSIAIFKGLQGETEINPRVTTQVRIVNSMAGEVLVSEISIPTLLEGFCGAKTGQAELSADVLALLWREVSPFGSKALAERMSAAMIEQAISSIEATLVMLIPLICQNRADLSPNTTPSFFCQLKVLNADVDCNEQLIKLSKMVWRNRFESLMSNPKTVRKEQSLCAL
ncbi:glycosyl transferase [Shewanella aestuarii]|uniref:Glycosyl transferase n=1 Tax=Shewanella aestuarii TaxID=1028752 RepID=A0A6G9QK83_9GAMM|nr:glycosyl transferase [Shewanella aestuarii]QIR14279.1 glycosyl transferase [Shewanella aestuarii]